MVLYGTNVQVSRRSHMCPSSLVTRADRKRQSSLVVARAGSDERVESKGAQGEDKSNSSPQPVGFRPSHSSLKLQFDKEK